MSDIYVHCSPAKVREEIPRAHELITSCPHCGAGTETAYGLAGGGMGLYITCNRDCGILCKDEDTSSLEELNASLQQSLSEQRKQMERLEAALNQAAPGLDLVAVRRGLAPEKIRRRLLEECWPVVLDREEVKATKG